MPALTLSTLTIGKVGIYFRLGVLPTSTHFREGIYPLNKFPFLIGEESSGTVVGLPTDTAVLNDPDYQKRGYKVGSVVAVVGISVR